MASVTPPGGSQQPGQTPQVEHPDRMQEWRKVFDRGFSVGDKMTDKQFQEFIDNLNRMISQQISQEKAEAKKASEHLKKAEEGEND